MKQLTVLFLTLFALASCNHSQSKESAKNTEQKEVFKNITKFDTTTKTIHIYVALCDNKYQGIVPVPPKIGNGQDPNSNLYWGCSFGIRTYFKKSKEWDLIKSQKLDSIRLERLVFKHKQKNYYMVADAYDGRYIKQCTKDFLKSSSGQTKDTLKINKTTIGISGNSKLISYIGHDGLMDFQLSDNYQNTDNIKRDVIILACYSRKYFTPHLKSANVNPLVWTTGLMCPEAYTVHDAITGYLKKETNSQIRMRAALAYSKYQKCSEGAAKNLLVTDW